MNNWTAIKFSEINPNPEVIPAGEYVFSLNGAKYNDTDKNKVECNATIVSEGDFTGRKLFFSYPDPAVYDWSTKAFKRMESALGTDMADGADPIEYLNSVAGTHFGASTKVRPEDKERGYPAKADIQLFSVHPAA